MLVLRLRTSPPPAMASGVMQTLVDLELPEKRYTDFIEQCLVACQELPEELRKDFMEQFLITRQELPEELFHRQPSEIFAPPLPQNFHRHLDFRHAWPLQMGLRRAPMTPREAPLKRLEKTMERLLLRRRLLRRLLRG